MGCRNINNLAMTFRLHFSGLQKQAGQYIERGQWITKMMLIKLCTKLTNWTHKFKNIMCFTYLGTNHSERPTFCVCVLTNTAIDVITQSRSINFRVFEITGHGVVHYLCTLIFMCGCTIWKLITYLKFINHDRLQTKQWTTSSSVCRTASSTHMNNHAHFTTYFKLTIC
jgi:hypothetical protein